MSGRGRPTKSEIILLGLTAVFLCALAGLSLRDRQETSSFSARRIIAYREANGPFGSIEEIMEVSGIGEAKFAELEDRVTVDNGKGEVTNEDSGG